MKRAYRIRGALTAALLLISPAGTAAWQATGLDDLLTEADTANPEIVAARRMAEAAAARVPQAGALPDPMLGLGLMNVPVANPGLGREMMTMMQVQMSGTLPWPGKLGLKEEVALLRAEAAEFEVERVRDRIAAEVGTAYYRIYFIDRALEVTGRNETLVGDFAQLTATKYGVGSGVQPDVLKAQVERTRLSDQVITLVERRESELARLNALLGRTTETPLPTTELPAEVRVAALAQPPDGPRFASSALDDVVPASRPDDGLPSTAELQALALDQNPMIQAHVRRVAAQERSLALARTATLPDFNVTAGYSYRSGFGDFFNVMVSAPLPIFAGRKQGQGVVEQAAVLDDHRARHHAMVNELNAEIASLAAELRRTRDQLVLLDDGILPQARAGLESSTSAYRVGRVDFLTLLDAQVTLYRHELDRHRLLTDFAENLAALERAVGTEVLR